MPPIQRRVAPPRRDPVEEYLDNVERWTRIAISGATGHPEEQTGAAVYAQAATANAIAALAVAAVELAAALKAAPPPPPTS
jgi:hypothetical protein